MKQHTVGIIMNGVTGRMGTNQHLLRSIAEIIRQGGVKCGSSETIMPDPILVGRNETKLKNLCNISGISKMSTDLDEVLKDRNYQLYFDAQTTGRRVDAVKKAIRAGKHIYCEKPVAISTEAALELYELCRDAGLKNGVVQDKLWLPGILKLKRLIETGFFGRILSVRGNSDTGCLREKPFRHKGLHGITAARTTAVLYWICCATGDMSLTMFSEK